MVELESGLDMQYPKVLFLLFKDGIDLDLGMESFSCKQSLHTLSPGPNSFTFLTESQSMFLFINFQTSSLSVVEVLLCSSLNDYLYKLHLILNLFS